MVLFCNVDGSVQGLSKDMDTNTYHALSTMKGDEVVDKGALYLFFQVINHTDYTISSLLAMQRKRNLGCRWFFLALLAICFSGCGGNEPKVIMPENPTLPPKNARLMSNDQVGPLDGSEQSQSQQQPSQ